MTKSNLRRRTSMTSLPICQTERCFGPSRRATRSTASASSATPAISTTAAAAPPTATVTRARGNLRRIAPSAGRLRITSPSCPKSITRMLRGSKLISALNDTTRPTVSHEGRAPSSRPGLEDAEVAAGHVFGLGEAEQTEDGGGHVFEGAVGAEFDAEGVGVNQMKRDGVGGVRGVGLARLRVEH